MDSPQSWIPANQNEVIYVFKFKGTAEKRIILELLKRRDKALKKTLYIFTKAS